MVKMDVKIEKIDIQPGARKLKNTWTVELDPEPVILYYYPLFWMRVYDRILNIFGKGKNIYTHDEVSASDSVLYERFK